jgi:hypothetical protein
VTARLHIGRALVWLLVACNWVVLVAFVLAGALFFGGIALRSWVSGAEEVGAYAAGTASLLGPVPMGAAVVVGTAAALVHLAGGLEAFWRGPAPLNLSFASLCFAALSLPPPSVSYMGVAFAVVGVAGAAALKFRGAEIRKWMLPLLLVAPYVGVATPLAFTAPLAASVVLLGTWTYTRFGRDGSRPA